MGTVWFRGGMWLPRPTRWPQDSQGLLPTRPGWWSLYLGTCRVVSWAFAILGSPYFLACAQSGVQEAEQGTGLLIELEGAGGCLDG